MDFHRARILEALGRTIESAALLKPVLAQPSLLEPGAAWELRASRLSAEAAARPRRQPLRADAFAEPAL